MIQSRNAQRSFWGHTQARPSGARGPERQPGPSLGPLSLREKSLTPWVTWILEPKLDASHGTREVAALPSTTSLSTADQVLGAALGPGNKQVVELAQTVGTACALKPPC